ncbi:MAG: DUF2220 family protein [Victivallaceae bacterium]|nr:DUF2220 family protein [Victivallaceae bacterium]
MNEYDYRKLIRARLDAAPRLEQYLKKVVACCSAKIPGQITLDAFGKVELFTMGQLFHPQALKIRSGKVVLIPQKMIEAGIDFKSWLEAAASLVAVGLNSEGKKGESPEQLIGKLEMLYPAFSAAFEILKEQNSAVKKKITVLGFDAALAHYRLALDAAEYLMNSEVMLSPAEFGAKFTGNSKSFKPGSAIWNLSAMLLAAELNVAPETVMSACGLIENPTASTVAVYGTFICYRGDTRLDWISELWKLGEAAILHAGNLEHLTRIEIEDAAVPEVITCENESPFNFMRREPDLPPLVYTAGFPNSTVRRFLALLPQQTEIRHWGDTDPEGLAIAAIINRIRPVELFRCGINECEKLSGSLIPLDKRKRKRGEVILRDSKFPFRRELEFSLNHGWLEQESWTQF